VLPLAAVVAPSLSRGAGVRAGVLLLASGLAVLAWVARESVVLIGLGLAICGVGIGLCVPQLSGRAGVMSVASRHAGLIVGLLLLSPLLAHGLSSNAQRAQRSAAVQVVTAPLPLSTKVPLAADLFQTVRSGSGGNVPNLGGPFARARARGGDNRALDALQHRLTVTERSAVSSAFASPFATAALLALAALAALALLPDRRRAPGIHGA